MNECSAHFETLPGVSDLHARVFPRVQESKCLPGFGRMSQPGGNSRRAGSA